MLSFIDVRNGGNLDVNNCQFIGIPSSNKTEWRSNWRGHALDILPTAGVVKISNSSFNEFGGDNFNAETEDGYVYEYGCICVWDKELIFSDERGDSIELECIGNVFENNYCYPFVEISDPGNGGYIIYNTDKYVFRNNTLKGYNKPNSITRKELEDGNRLHHFLYNIPDDYV